MRFLILFLLKFGPFCNFFIKPLVLNSVTPVTITKTMYTTKGEHLSVLNNELIVDEISLSIIL